MHIRFTAHLAPLLLTVASPGLMLLACGGSDSSNEGGDTSISTGKTTSDIEVPDATTGGDDGCTRAEVVSAVTVLRPEPFDVVLVADNSGSIGWSKDALSSGLRNLLSLVHGQDVRFFLLSPTQYGASSQDARDRVGGDLVVYADEATQMPHENAVTRYEQSCTDQEGKPADCANRFTAGYGLSVRGTWAFEMPAPIAAITPDMDAIQIEEQQDRIAEEVLALGTNGAQSEQPICTLSRYITRAPELLPKHAVFVVLSDEDDVSDPADCLESYAYDAEPAGAFDGPCDQDCDYYQYQMISPRQLQSITATCTPVDDQGQPRPESATTSSVSSSAKLCVEGKTDCDAEDIELFSRFCTDGGLVSDCTAACGGSAVLLTCDLRRAEDTIDLCNAGFSEAGVDYVNLGDYCETTAAEEGPWMDCESQGYDEDSIVAYSGPETFTQVIDATTIDEQASEFHRLAESAFGNGGYFVESIVFAPDFDCELKSGQSYGTQLAALASSPDDVFPICGDYAPALARIESFAQRLVNNHFTLSLASDEMVIGVSIQSRDGELRPLSDGDYDFDRDDGSLTVDEDLLLPSDLGIEVNIEDSCIEIVR